MNKITEHVGSRKSAPVPRPVVTLSYAQTLDGRLATSTGSSQWISSPRSLRFSHELRAEHEAIMVGAGTVCMDDPRLTVRLAAGPNPQRVVVDSTLRAPLTAAVLVNGAAPGTVFAVTGRAPAAKREKVRALGIRELARTLIVTDTWLSRYGGDLVLEGQVEYPGAPPMTVETREDLGCVTA